MRVFLTIILCFNFILAYASPIDLAGKPFAVQCRLYDSLRSEFLKDKNVDLTSKLEPYIEQAITQDDPALEIFLRLQLLDDLNRLGEISNSDFENRIKLLKLKCEQKNFNNLLAICYYVYSKYYERKSMSADAIKYALMSYDLFSKIDKSEFIYKYQYLLHLAHRYMDYSDCESALKYLHMADAESGGYNPGALNSMALACAGLDRYDSALYYYDRLYRESIENNNRFWSLTALGNASDVFIGKEMYDTALKLCLAMNKEMAKGAGAYRSKGDSYTETGYLYYVLNDLPLADSYYHVALDTFRKIGAYWYYDQLESAKVFFREYARVKRSMGDYKTACFYNDTVSLVTDSMNKLLDINQLKNVERKLQQVKYENANRELAYQKTKTKLQRNLSIVGIIAVTFIILFIVNRQKIRQQSLEREKDTANYELKLSQDRLTDFMQRIQEKNRLLENMEQKLNAYGQNEQNEVYNDALDELKNATILTDEEWDDFKRTFETVHKGFINRLQQQYPTLTQAELRYIVLVKLGMNNKEMASVLGISSGSVRTLKSRIIKKMEFATEEELAEMIRTV